MARGAERFFGALLLVAATLILPGLAFAPVCARFGAAAALAPLAVSVVSFSAYAIDKRRAGRARARIAEATLLTLDAVGGWPGGLVAQQWLRHKTAKTGYQVVFWLIVLGYQGAAAWRLFG